MFVQMGKKATGLEQLEQEKQLPLQDTEGSINTSGQTRIRTFSSAADSDQIKKTTLTQSNIQKQPKY